MIYLDYAAATPVNKKVLLKMEPYFSDQFFNPSAPYLPAKHVRDNYEYAKSELAHAIGAKGADLVITSGATESINLAFTAVNKDSSVKNQVLYLATEHAAVREAAGIFPHVEIPVDKTGMVIIKELKQMITPDTVLISVSLANNELGTIQPLSEISEIIQSVRQERLASGNATPLYLHSDASQALSLVDINVARLGTDLLTINSAKVYGPKGIGALYVGHGVKLKPIVRGGGQERGLRSGTENVPALIGFAAAATIAKEHINGNRKHYQELTQIFKNELKDCMVEPIFLGNKKHQLANFCTICFPGIDAERLIYKLESKSVYVSTGAACAASKGEKSHTLVAIGLSDSEIAGSLRISMGADNTKDDIVTAARLIKQAVNEEKERMK